eukprot:2080911-Lingulodinium_polyedra.AAC.1
MLCSTPYPWPEATYCTLACTDVYNAQMTSMRCAQACAPATPQLRIPIAQFVDRGKTCAMQACRYTFQVHAQPHVLEH